MPRPLPPPRAHNFIGSCDCRRWAAGYNLIGIPLAAGAALPFTGLALTPSLSGALAWQRCRLAAAVRRCGEQLPGLRTASPPVSAASPCWNIHLFVSHQHIASGLVHTTCPIPLQAP